MPTTRIKRNLYALLVVIAILTLMVWIAGCNTLTLPKDATPAEKRAALCVDAQTALAVAQTALGDPGTTAHGKTYWTRFADGAQIGISAYCGQGNGG